MDARRVVSLRSVAFGSSPTPPKTNAVSRWSSHSRDICFQMMIANRSLSDPACDYDEMRHQTSSHFLDKRVAELMIPAIE